MEVGNTLLKHLRFVDDKLLGKCEFLNSSGSHKDRLMQVWIPDLIRDGHKKFVISSSGNAAIATAAYSPQIDLKIFVNNISNSKKNRLAQYNANVEYSKRPKHDAIKYARENNAFLLRASVHKQARLGYYKLAEELGDIDAIFIPTSSGVTLLGIYEGYKKLGMKCPALHAVQTESVHPLISSHESNSEPSSSLRQRGDALTVAKAICDRVMKLKKEVQEAIRKTGGDAWIAREEDIIANTKLLQNNNFNISAESGAVLSAYLYAKDKGMEYGKPVLLLTGIA